MEIVLIGKWGWTIILSLFMPISSIVFYRYSLPKKEASYADFFKTTSSLKEQPTSLQRAERKVEAQEPYSIIEYGVSVTFATGVCFLGHFAVNLATDYNLAEFPSQLFSGTHSGEPGYQETSVLAISMGFLGGYVWSIQNILRRFFTLDITPSIYFSAAIRMILASLVALMFRHFLAAVPFEEYTEHLLPVVAFLTGMFPERAMHRMIEYIFPDRGQEMAHPLPLDMIDGISLLHRVRLHEVGIDNAQNLAEANLAELVVRTPFEVRQLVDWISQAKLYVFCKDDIKKLRESYITTIFDIKKIGDDDEKDLDETARIAGVPASKLHLLYHRIKEDPDLKRLFELKECKE